MPRSSSTISLVSPVGDRNGDQVRCTQLYTEMAYAVTSSSLLRPPASCSAAC